MWHALFVVKNVNRRQFNTREVFRLIIVNGQCLQEPTLDLEVL